MMLDVPFDFGNINRPGRAALVARPRWSWRMDAGGLGPRGR